MNELDFYDIDAHLERVILEAKTITDTFAKESERGLFIRRTGVLRALVSERHEAGKTVAELTRGELMQRLFADLTPGSVRTQLSRFRGHLEKVGCAGPGRFLLAIPDARGAGAEAAVCKFEGDSMAQRRLAEGTRDAIASLRREHTIVPPRGWPDVPRFFISFAWADRDLVNVFLEELRVTLRLIGVSQFEFWKCDDYRQTDSGIPVGSDIEKTISQAMQRCPFALLLLSPAYCESGIINRLERPYFFGPEAKGIGLPVGVGAYRPDHKHVNCPGFSEGLVYFLPKTKGDPHDLSYCDLRRNDRRREAFVRGLAERIKALLAQHHPVDPVLPPADEHALPPEMLDPANFLDETRGKFIPQRAQKQLTLTSETSGGESGVDLLNELTGWLAERRGAAYCALLGETGSGKTMACLELCRLLLEKRETTSSLPVPIYLDLRLVNQDGLLANNPEARPLLADILTAIVRRSAQTMPMPGAILRAVQTQGALLVWDGLDEVLVHLSEQAGEAFFAELRKSLPVEIAGQAGAGRLLFACRTQYFRGMAHEVSLFTESRKSGINPAAGGKEDLDPPHARYLVLRVLPFEEEQIRAYLLANVPGVDLDRALEVIDSVHNLRELAGRPFLLSLMRPFLARLDHQLAAGRSLRSVDLYAGFVQEWQERNAKMDRIISDDKPLLMQRLAAHLWQEGMKSIPCEALNRWLRREIVSDPVWIHTYGDALKSHPEALLEHFRDATFLGRWDGEAFRFAHTSLQEYFLACHLVEALEAGKAEAWELPMPSRETFDFMVELRQRRAQESPAAARRMDATLAGILRESPKGYTPTAGEGWCIGFSRNDTPQSQQKLTALAFWLRSHQPGQPEQPIPGMDLSGLDLTVWLIASGGGPWGGKTPDVAPAVRLGMAGLRALGTVLLRAGFGAVDLSGADFTGADLRTVEFQYCRLTNINWPELANGLLVRNCGHGLDIPSRGLRLIDGVHSLPAIPSEKDWHAMPRTGHSGGIRECVWSPDGSQIAAASEDKTISVFEAGCGALLRKFVGHDNWGRSCAYSPDGTLLASASDDCSVFIWEIQTGEKKDLLEHEDDVFDCEFAPDGKSLVSASRDGMIRIWDLNHPGEYRIFEEHQAMALCCAFFHDGSLLCTGDSAGVIHVWDVKTGRIEQTFSEADEWVRSCRFSPKGRSLLSAAIDGAVVLRDLSTTGKRTEVIKNVFLCGCADFSPDGERIIFGNGYDVAVVNSPFDRLLPPFQGHTEAINSCHFSPDGMLAVSGSDDRTILIWDTNAGCLLREIEGHWAAARNFAVTPDGKAISAHLDRDIIVKWDLQSGGALTPNDTDRRAAEVGHYGDLWDSAGIDCPWEITPTGTLVQTDPGTGAFLREICPFNDGEWAVLEPWNRELDEPRGIPENVKVVIRRATPGAWRWLGYVARTPDGLYVPGAPVLEAEAFGPLPPA
jgi:WD40 repeat protein